jgi:hypothetical protein
VLHGRRSLDQDACLSVRLLTTAAAAIRLSSDWTVRCFGAQRLGIKKHPERLYGQSVAGNLPGASSVRLRNGLIRTVDRWSIMLG